MLLPNFKPKRTRYESGKLWDKQLLIHIGRKSTTRFTKSPSLVLISLVKSVKINKEMYGYPGAVFGKPYISL